MFALPHICYHRHHHHHIISPSPQRMVYVLQKWDAMAEGAKEQRRQQAREMMGVGKMYNNDIDD